ncbi:PTS sugar transporter subunit IIA [Anaerorhabdus furcosa]|uniref:PTS system, glucose-specific IIA component n=1 Tax=Anaerorhabdus furcosa TaxID=118967 RepID=A0A1T4L8D8_9FIRM|nr:PTS glucose transporter subunit IIA [Anaerorhabdus furcosa]SJZ50986.1 PTS system, glucose-specific IIA component [Anaerorhabdus furcosa]
MFNFMKKDNCEIVAPSDGNVVQLESIDDPMFSQKMLGDGFAIKLKSDYVVSPVTGEVIVVFPTNHAIGIRTQDGIEVLIHIGFDTVNEKGNGFESYVTVGTKVKKGSTLVKVDRAYFESRGYDLTTPCIITNMDKIQSLDINFDIDAVCGKTVIGKYTLKV